jgi:hypothetical protein
MASSPLWDAWLYFCKCVWSDHCGAGSHGGGGVVLSVEKTGLSVIILVIQRNTTRRHNPKDLDLNLHRRENLKSCADYCLVDKYFDNILKFYEVSYINIHFVQGVLSVQAL